MNDQPALMKREDGKLDIFFTPEAERMKADALESSGLICKVQNADQNELAVAAQMNLTRVVKLVEDARIEAKKPILDAGRTLDTKCKTFVETVTTELRRVEKLVASFAEVERLKAVAAQNAANEAASAMERDREAELAKVNTVEEADRIREDYSQRQSAISVPQAPARVEGQNIREDWEVTVTDVWALTRAHPNCVKVEPRLTEIKQLLDAGVKVAGVSAKKVTKAGVRLPTSKALTV